MNTESLIGQRVMNINTRPQGIITGIEDGHIYVDFYGDIIRYLFSSCFDTQLK